MNPPPDQTCEDLLLWTWLSEQYSLQKSTALSGCIPTLLIVTHNARMHDATLRPVKPYYSLLQTNLQHMCVCEGGGGGGGRARACVHGLICACVYATYPHRMPLECHCPLGYLTTTLSKHVCTFMCLCLSQYSGRRMGGGGGGGELCAKGWCDSVCE